MQISNIRKAAVQLAVASALVLSAGAAIAETISSSIEGSNCVRRFNSFVVPNGKTATGFQILGLQAGRTCKTNQMINRKGFSIRDGNYNTIFRSSGGGVGGLTLGPGTYSVVVDGGNGAKVTLSYVLR
jgi:hypothetical protein